MDNGTDTPLERLLAAERRFHELAPIRDLYSKLLVRTVLWFLFFVSVYTVVTALL